VAIRHDPARRGKGYGLSHGIEQLRLSPPDVVVLFDADCEIESGVVERLAAEALYYDRPIQATYLLESPPDAGARGVISTLAFTVKNAARPAGLAALGLPCALTGTGMAFPWALIEGAPLASGHLVEDMELGLYLQRGGRAPRLCAAVKVRGQMPTDVHSAYSQRTRWEHGHLSVICSRALPLLRDGLRLRRFEFVATALDLAVPPLALVAAAWAAGAAVSLAVGIICGLWIAAALFAVTGIMLAAAVAIAWRRYARQLPLLAVLAVPAYVLWKIPLYFGFIFKRQTQWVRTTRQSPAETQGPTIA